MFVVVAIVLAVEAVADALDVAVVVNIVAAADDERYSYSIILYIFYTYLLQKSPEFVQNNILSMTSPCDQLAHSPAFQVTVASRPPVAKRVLQPVGVSTWTNTGRAPGSVNPQGCCD